MLLGLFSRKLGFGRSQEIHYVLALVEAETGQGTGSCMTCKLANFLPLFLNVRTWKSLLFTSGLLNEFIQVKIIEV